MTPATTAPLRSTDSARSALPVGRRGGWARGWLLLAATLVLAVGAAARLALLRDVPRLTDETDEVMRGLAVARGELLPLTNVDAYIGPLWSYLLALGFLVTGPTSLMPRVLTVLLGLLTVAAAGWLGSELSRRVGWERPARLVALGTALLLATSSFHAVVPSRIAWSHALTPLMMTLALAALLRWERRRSGAAMVLAGLGYGLAVHTHPTAVAFAPGLAVWALLRWRALVGAPAAWGGLALGVLVNLPMLTFNLLTGFTSLDAAAQVQAAYAEGQAAGPGRYAQNLGALLVSIPLLLAGEIGERRGDLPPTDPSAFVFLGLVALGLVVATRRGVLVPLLTLLSAALVLPAVNGKYEPLFNGRYMAPLLPLWLGLVIVGVLVTIHRLARGERTRAVLVVAALGGLSLPPLTSLARYLEVAERDGPNNRELHRAVEIVAAARPTMPVLVDATLSGTRLSTEREGVGVLEYLLVLDGRLATRRLQPDELVRAVERGEAEIVVVSQRLAARLGKDFETAAPPGEDEARRRRRAGFIVLRIVGAAAQAPLSPSLGAQAAVPANLDVR